MKRKKTKEDLRFDARTNNSIICKCGHSVFVPHYAKRILCDWCNRWVYRDKKEEFKEKMQSQLRRKM